MKLKMSVFCSLFVCLFVTCNQRFCDCFSSDVIEETFFSFNYPAIISEFGRFICLTLWCMVPWPQNVKHNQSSSNPKLFAIFIHPLLTHVISHLSQPLQLFSSFNKKYDSRNKPNVQYRNRTWTLTAGVAPQHKMSGGWIFHAALDVWRPINV